MTRTRNNSEYRSSFQAELLRRRYWVGVFYSEGKDIGEITDLLAAKGIKVSKSTTLGDIGFLCQTWSALAARKLVQDTRAKALEQLKAILSSNLSKVARAGIETVIETLRALP